MLQKGRVSNGIWHYNNQNSVLDFIPLTMDLAHRPSGRLVAWRGWWLGFSGHVVWVGWLGFHLLQLLSVLLAGREQMSPDLRERAQYIDWLFPQAGSVLEERVPPPPCHSFPYLWLCLAWELRLEVHAYYKSDILTKLSLLRSADAATATSCREKQGHLLWPLEIVLTLVELGVVYLELGYGKEVGASHPPISIISCMVVIFRC